MYGMTTSHNPMGTYGASYGATGFPVRALIYNVVVYGALGYGLGYMVPKFTPEDGAKWGAMLGAGQTALLHLTSA